MASDRLVRICLVLMTVLLAVIAFRPVFLPPDTHAQKHYEYQIAPVDQFNAPTVLAKYTKDGWEPMTLSFYSPSGKGEGFLLLRK